MARPGDPPDPSDSTQVHARLPWAQTALRPGQPRLHLTLLWYDEDERVGQSAIVSRPCTLGRGLGDGQSPRLEFVEQRPGGSEPRGSLNSPLLSRTQLRLVPEGNALRVENKGRRPLLHNGLQTDAAVVRPGDTLTLLDTAIFLLELREPLWPAGARAVAPFAFGRADAHGLAGESAAAWQLRDEIAAAAGADAHVLIHGASGAGKELAARTIHQCSARAAGPLVSRNAATLPQGLIDAELFGNIRNYPNAGSPERIGIVGEAEGGTLLLDEIGELPRAEQAHLLRALDRGGEYQRLGDARVRRANLRVVALTNRDLGDLKHDFVARFPIRIRVPSLDERRSDVPLLMRAIWHELQRQQPELAKRFDARPSVSGIWQPMIEPRLLELFMRHPFEGNYRELEQLLRLAITTSPGRYVAVTPRLLEALAPVASPVVLSDRDALLAALEAARGSPTLAAQRLGLKNRHVLYRLMKKHGVGSKL